MKQIDFGIFPAEDALEMILVFDGKGTIIYANAVAREKLGYNVEICGISIGAVFPNSFEQSEDSFKTEYQFGGGIQNLMAYRKNLTCFPVETRILKNDGQGLYICLANDILEKEYLNREIDKVRQEAQEALKVKSEFVANVTHELRTPVNGILGNVKELMPDEENVKRLRTLKLIERCCGDMNKIINNILDFSKMEAGKFTLEPRRFHFRNMLDYVKESHISRITEKGLEFFVTVSPHVPEYIIGDELRIVQILNNLLLNAQKFTAVGKISVEIMLTAQMKDSIELFFFVHDTGIGIDKADQDKLFQSFSQVDASISRKYGGTGLGLNICKQLVELMGGNIEVESKVNQGTTFSFSIWVGVEKADMEQANPLGEIAAFDKASLFSQEEQQDDIKVFGTADNKEALQKNMSKLILCVEMENWEKAESFMDTIKQLSAGAPREVSRAVLRLKMAIQKEDYDTAVTGFDELKILVE
jgi:signal transduction histidine kinase